MYVECIFGEISYLKLCYFLIKFYIYSVCSALSDYVMYDCV